MPSVEFREDQLGDLQKLAQQMFDDENDPRSRAYRRILVRPKIRWSRLVLWVLIPAVLGVGVRLMSGMLPGDWRLWLIVLLAVYLCCTAKRITILLIQIYQRFAPDSIRMKCRFEPSCSEYMVQALRKYGFLKGLVKGIRRLSRCNINGGGFDEP